MPRARTALTAVVAVTLAGCSLAPPYGVPPAPIAPVYKELGKWQPVEVGVAPGPWWSAFGDTMLDELEARIESGNPDLAAAVARYDQARGQLRESQAAQLPSLDAGASAERARVSAGRPLSSNGAARYTDLRLGGSLAYEIDLFGRVRNSVRANAADAQASEQDVAAVRLGLQATLADYYFQMRGLDARAVLLRQTVTAFERAFELTDTRHSGGIASGIDVSRSAALLSSARAELSAVAGDRAAFEHAIAALVGESPSSFSIPVAETQRQPPAIPVGVPSTLLQRRPDIVAAERRVAAANARIGVARAALFPSLTLGASGGFEAGNRDILSAPNGFWALGPLSAALSIFDGGARRARVRISRAQYDEAVASYRSTVLAAFREVEDDLARAHSLAAQEQDQQAATRAAERTRDLALIRYRDGASDYLEVVTAQTAALDAQRSLLEVQSRRLQIAVDTVRAVGGTTAE
ncbi:efflux transporter outer membrane subunit [Sphingomonas sp. So64.6b]|uniref:efflux transporter outer membrane subunit n=1 Tax=Sphingomonas sp. So64.6b TaxID=2997354 RepID=UPI0016010BF3|nr:efflux transporter outer membrane subunit [Sphingomonas sp. So64.6b]QNA82712.1 efflux transporter outer membrane subunit [Sphingomonas sp. So64.6b]